MSVQRIFDQYMRCKSVSTDSRNIVPQSIFFALKGANFNGNQFALQALESGASMAVVDEDVASNHPDVVRVANVQEALQQLARDYRRTFSIPFLGITGSNGKTTTKELVRDVLARKYKVHATKGNLNNHLGVPLTLLAMPADTQMAIIEMGANHQREIHGLCQIAEPDFGLITNIGKAHLEGFGGPEGVKKGKKELFDWVHAHGGKVLVNTDLPVLDEISAGMDRITFGFQCSAFHIELVSAMPELLFDVTRNGQSQRVKTALAGAYNLYNIASAMMCGIHFGVEWPAVLDAIASYIPDNNRSQLKRTANNLLILDAYNANPTSMVEALQNLARQEGNTFFVMGEMREMGQHEAEEHRSILHLAQQLGLKGITVGEAFHRLSKEFDFPSFVTTVSARDYLVRNPLQGYTVLVKGSRGIRLEELVDTL
ncbi:MAG: UDP-N-acetylmuramoyl-tripeptide--D-alanyl-D-alanine ligase [Flavobacteriales bacterium]|nr:UDP-N-acetylmuramoyl-tripeptide--D-alanyl-D-alanine ligase [Flavobacteriales bacterium]